MADTSYLLPFGVGDGRRVLRALHPKAVLAPTSVRGELQRISGHQDRLKKGAAAALLSPRGTPIVYEEIDTADTGYRDGLLDELHDIAVARGRRAAGRRPAGSTEDLGEADCMCLSRGSDEPMRCNDDAAREVATQHGIATLSTAEDLRRLLDDDDYTANKLAQIARRMDRLGIGAVIGGPAYFRRPQRRPEPPPAWADPSSEPDGAQDADSRHRPSGGAR